MKTLLNILLFCVLPTLMAQEVKQEREQRIAAKEMPAEALAYLKTLPVKKKKVRHYLEQDGTRTSYESKFKANGTRYSVEFNQQGELQDIEIERSKKEMALVLNAVETYLENQFERHRIEKIQAHYQSDKSFRTNYRASPDSWELIIATKDSKNKLERFEMTFDSKGNFLKSRKVARQSYEFLLF